MARRKMPVAFAGNHLLRGATAGGKRLGENCFSGRSWGEAPDKLLMSLSPGQEQGQSGVLSKRSCGNPACTGYCCIMTIIPPWSLLASWCSGPHFPQDGAGSVGYLRWPCTGTVWLCAFIPVNFAVEQRKRGRGSRAFRCAAPMGGGKADGSYGSLLGGTWTPRRRRNECLTLEHILLAMTHEYMGCVIL